MGHNTAWKIPRKVVTCWRDGNYREKSIQNYTEEKKLVWSRNCWNSEVFMEKTERNTRINNKKLQEIDRQTREHKKKDNKEKSSAITKHQRL